MDKSAIIVLTEAYPVIQYEFFLEDEMKIISPYFQKIIFVTEEQPESTPKPFYPENSIVFKHNTKPTFYNKVICIKFLFHLFFIKEIFFILKNNKKTHLYAIFKIMFIELAKAQRIVQILNDVLKNINPEFSKIYFYSYWHNHKALALALLKKKKNNFNCFARAHGWDVFAERHPIPYLPFKNFILNTLDCTYSISETGKNELLKKYTIINTSSIKVSRLGKINHYPFVAKYNTNTFLILSCSELLPVKRIHLIIELISVLDIKNLKWIHFGEGPLRDELEELAKNKLQNIDYAFKGLVPNKEIMEFYYNNTVDLFVNLSEAEGIPVSIMEALSFGVPVLATNVGGTAEAVNNNHGFLIEKDFEMETVANIVKNYLLAPVETKLIYKQNAYKYWAEHFDAEKNYTDFVKSVLNNHNI